MSSILTRTWTNTQLNVGVRNNAFSVTDRFLELAKIGKTHLAIYQAADKPVYSELRQKAYENFVEVYKKAMSKDKITQDLCSLTNLALKDPDSRMKLTSRILECARGNIEVVKASDLNKILATYCDRLWARTLEPKVTIVRPSNAIGTEHEPLIHLADSSSSSNVSDPPIKGTLDQPASEADTHPTPDEVSATQVAKESEVVGNPTITESEPTPALYSVMKENTRLKNIVKNGSLANASLKSELERATLRIKELEAEAKMKELGIQELEKHKVLAEAENKMMVEKIVDKEQELLSVTSKLESTVKENQRLSKTEENARLLKSQLSDINDSAHHRKVVLLQKQIADLKTKHDNENSKLKEDLKCVEAQLVKTKASLQESETKLNMQVVAYKKNKQAEQAQSEQIKELEKRVDAERDARSAQGERIIVLQRRLQRNDELLSDQDRLRKDAEQLYDNAAVQVDKLRLAAEVANETLKANKQKIASLQQKINATKKEAEQAKEDYDKTYRC